MIPRFKLELITRKADLANWLGWQYRGSRYLEIATATTGHQFSLVSPAVFSTIHRAMYRLPPDYDDGLSIICRSESENSRECLAPLLASEDRYDVIFVDPFHTYDCSRRDLLLALTLLAPGGVLVVHDCHPTDPELAAPSFKPGEWLGQTYLAFLDLMRERPELDYSVVDIDYGCGVVRQRPPGTRQDRSVLSTCDYRDWPTYFQHRRALLNLVGIEAFLEQQRARPRSLMATAATMAVRVRRRLRNRIAVPRVKR